MASDSERLDVAITVQLGRTLADRVRAAAARDQRTLSAWIRLAIEAELEARARLGR